MATDLRTTALTALASLSADDLFYVVDDPAGAATSHKLATSVLDARFASAAQGALAATALQAANNLSDVANAATARANLGLAIGTNVQAYDAFLTSIALLGTAADKMIYTTGVDTAAETALTAFARSILDDANEAAFKATVNLEIGVDVQAWDTDLDTIAGLAKTDGNFIVGDGAAWTVESGATARTSLGLGTIATQNANAVTISGGSITGITDLAIADGGTGQSTAQAAIDALSNVAAATNEHVLTKDTASGNAIFKAAPATGAPVGAKYIVQQADATLTDEQALGALATGLLKNTTTSGVLSIGVAGTDYAGITFANVFSAAQTIATNTSGTIGLKVKTLDNSATIFDTQNLSGNSLFNVTFNGMTITCDNFYTFATNVLTIKESGVDRITIGRGGQFRAETFSNSTEGTLLMYATLSAGNNQFRLLDKPGGTLMVMIGKLSGTFAGRVDLASNSYVLGAIGQADQLNTLIKAHSTQTTSLLEIQDNSGNIYSKFNKAGYFMTKKIAAPADGDLATSEMAIWFDNTVGAAKLMIKAKDSAGTVVTGSVALA